MFVTILIECICSSAETLMSLSITLLYHSHIILSLISFLQDDSPRQDLSMPRIVVFLNILC
jgi:hypothetical protein